MKCERGGDSHYSICKIKQSWKWHLRLEDRAVKVWYREQEREWWLKFSVWGSRAPLWGLASIPHGWWMQESCLPARFGSCRGNCAAFGGRVVSLHTGSEVSGRLREGGMELSSASTDLKQSRWNDLQSGFYLWNIMLSFQKENSQMFFLLLPRYILAYM